MVVTSRAASTQSCRLQRCSAGIDLEDGEMSEVLGHLQEVPAFVAQLEAALASGEDAEQPSPAAAGPAAMPTCAGSPLERAGVYAKADFATIRRPLARLTRLTTPSSG